MFLLCKELSLKIERPASVWQFEYRSIPCFKNKLCQFTRDKMLTRNSAVCLDTDLARACPFYPIISEWSTQPPQLLGAQFMCHMSAASLPRRCHLKWTEGKDKIWRRSHKVAMARFPAKDDGLVFCVWKNMEGLEGMTSTLGWWSRAQLIGWRLLVMVDALKMFDDVWTILNTEREGRWAIARFQRDRRNKCNRMNFYKISKVDSWQMYLELF